MATDNISLTARPGLFTGLSTDTKPTPTSGFSGDDRVDSIFYELDTGNKWIYIVDTGTGAWYQIWDRGSRIVSDPMVDIPAGHKAGYTSVNKFGKALDVDNGVDTDVWDGADGTTSTDVWVPPTTARTHDITSTSANDDGSPAGTGAHTVEIDGLDASYDLQSETVTLNGTANVATANTYVMIHRMKVTACGSVGGNAGIITATAQTDATITAAIQTGNNQTLMAIYIVPNGKTAYITNYYASFDGGTPTTTDGNIKLLAADTQATGTPFQLKHINSLRGGDNFRHDFEPYLKIDEKHIIKMKMDDCDTNNSALAAGFDLILVDD